MSRRTLRRLAVWPLAVLLALALLPAPGRAVLEGVYFTAANEQLLDLKEETMPFYSGGVLYVSSDVFQGTDLGVTFVYNSTTKTAMLYTARTDLRFDLANQVTRDKYGNRYQTYALERGGVVFLPLSTVCNFFDLTWTFNDTDTAPLIRVRSGSAILSDRDFIDAAANDMERRYAAYEEQVEESTAADPQVYPEYTGRRIHLLVESQSREDTLAVLSSLGETAQATFLLTAEQMADGDLLRALIAGGHGVALAASGETEETVEEQVTAARGRLWQAACGWLSLVYALSQSHEHPPLGPGLRVFAGGPGPAGHGAGHRRPGQERLGRGGALPAGSDHPPGGGQRLFGGPGHAAGGPGGAGVPGLRLAALGNLQKIQAIRRFCGIMATISMFCRPSAEGGGGGGGTWYGKKDLSSGGRPEHLRSHPHVSGKRGL